MLTSYFTGLSLMATLIIPIGVQNAFVLNQGIRKQHHLIVAGFCSISDALFMGFGVWGGAQLFAAYSWLLTTISLLGATFMLVYGWQCLRRVKQGNSGFVQTKNVTSLKVIILTCCAFTYLNPHVYIDTIVILGGFAANLDSAAKPSFFAGGVSASFIWFFSLALLGQRLSAILSKPIAQRIIDTVIGLMMWGLALYLINFILPEGTLS